MLLFHESRCTRCCFLWSTRSQVNDWNQIKHRLHGCCFYSLSLQLSVSAPTVCRQRLHFSTSNFARFPEFNLNRHNYWHAFTYLLLIYRAEPAMLLIYLLCKTTCKIRVAKVLQYWITTALYMCFWCLMLGHVYLSHICTFDSLLGH